MKKHLFCVIIFIGFVFSNSFSFAQTTQFPKLYKKASPATVLIKTDFKYINPVTQKTFYIFKKCSGSFIRSDGTILTSDHCIDVIKKEDLFDPDGNPVSTQIVYVPDYITVFVGAKQYQARVIILDPILRFALLKINGRFFPYLRFSRSRPIVGQTVMTIASSINGRNILKVGNVAIINNETPASLLSVNFIKSDLALSQGESGGPLLNINGELIGINDNRDTESTISSSVMIDKFLKYHIYCFANGRTITRPYLNINLNDMGLLDEDATRNTAQEIRKKLSIDFTRRQGMVVRIVDHPDIEPGDIIVALNGIVITNHLQFSRLLFTSKPYKPVWLTLLRAGKEIKILVTLPVEFITPK